VSTIEADPDTLKEFHEVMRATVAPSPPQLEIHKDKVEAGLARLVLTVIELLRQLLETQAIRRMEAGSLSVQQVEDMGETFLKLERKMEELKAHFGLQDADLNLDLGPLGNLM